MASQPDRVKARSRPTLMLTMVLVLTFVLVIFQFNCPDILQEELYCVEKGSCDFLLEIYFGLRLPELILDGVTLSVFLFSDR